jgi:hypothetical protein
VVEEIQRRARADAQSRAAAGTRGAGSGCKRQHRPPGARRTGATSACELVATPAGLLDIGTGHGNVPDLTLTARRRVALRPGPQAALRGEKPPGAASPATCSSPPKCNWLVDHVRWDLEEDLARVIGDAPAHMPLGSVMRRVADRGAAVRRARTPARPTRPRPSRQRHRARRADDALLPARCLHPLGRSLRYGLDELALLTSFQKPWLRVVARDHLRSGGAGISMRRAGNACARRWSISARSSSNSARCSPPGATCCRPTSPTSSRCLQDRVPPFPVEGGGRNDRTRSFRRPLAAVFEHLRRTTPVASASIAQVHFATIRTAPGRDPRCRGEGAAPQHAAA